MQSQKKQWEKVKIMNTIAVLLISLLSGIVIYQIIQLNILINKELITSEIYERLIKDTIKEIIALVTIVVVYFFGKESRNIEKLDNGED